MESNTFLRGRNGTSAIEFAIILPVFLLFLFGIIQFGFILYTQSDMFNAAREAARRLSVDETMTESQAQSIAENYLTSWPLSFTVTAENTGTTGDDFVRVTVTVPMSDAAFLADIVGLFEDRTLSAQVVMREEG
ncbi:MAG: TadE/TadG family type IV pilus assembly protein [Rhodovibrionaceae bacterium]|nr:TadE/TadG family type IV pilus assembly protein [Rhodovibrionaceae bacterium]